MNPNYTRRPIDLKGMIERRNKIRSAKENQKRNKFRTRTKINRRTASTDAMRLASGFEGGTSEGSIVYNEIDSHKTQLLESLPNVLNDKPYHLPEWRSLSEQAKVCFYQLGMLSTEFDENLIAAPFSFNMSEQLWRAASDAKTSDTVSTAPPENSP